ncbi:hypothetical protein MANES_08G134411v8 [Manihot esculenta]|uniref:Uncharacterized protein n=1 Tax=Manihot esculenta TaxID=3983 RepID=A0ACB7HBD3_MANES|nr:hypothetical protein MANES_08G134411v8 [Manihot esculenta]
MSSESQRAIDEEVESHAPSEAAAPAATPPPAAAGGPGQDALFQQIAELIRRVTQNVPEVPPPPPVAVQVPPPVVAQAQPRPPIEKLRKYGATDFRGKKEDDPSAAEFWLESTERVLQQLQCSPVDSLMCAVSLLKDEAYRWWTTLTQMVRPERQTWEFFLSEFKKKYVGALYIEERRREFLYLRQGRLTVTEYEREFVRLSKYATEIVPTEEERCKRFEQGLHADIRMYLTAMHIRELSVLVETAHSLERIKEEEQSRKQKGQQKRSQSQYQGQSSASQTSSKRQREFQQSGQRGPPRQIQRPGQSLVVRSGQQTTSVSSTGGPGRGLPPVCEHCGRRHGGVCRRLTGACYLCGTSEHFMKDCPRGQSVQPMQTERFMPSGSRGRGRGRGESSNAQSHRVSETVDRPDTRAPARAYAIRAKEDQDKPDVIAGEGTSKGKEIARE